MNKIIDNNCPILPEMIDCSKHFWNSFGRNEPEISANWLVRFAQKNNAWKPFTKNDIDKFYQEKYPSSYYSFNGLDNNYIMKEDHVYYYTLEFVAKCFASSPKILSLEEQYNNDWLEYFFKVIEFKR